MLVPIDLTQTLELLAMLTLEQIESLLESLAAFLLTPQLVAQLVALLQQQLLLLLLARALFQRQAQLMLALLEQLLAALQIRLRLLLQSGQLLHTLPQLTALVARVLQTGELHLFADQHAGLGQRAFQLPQAILAIVERRNGATAALPGTQLLQLAETLFQTLLAAQQHVLQAVQSLQ